MENSKHVAQLFQSRALPAWYDKTEKENAFHLPEFQQLDYLLARCREKSKNFRQPRSIVFTNEAVDRLLTDLFSGDFSRKQAKFFLAHNTYNPAFTEKILLNLRITAYPMHDEALESYVPSTNEIMAAIKAADPMKEKHPAFDIARALPKYLAIAGLLVITVFALHRPEPAQKMYKKHLSEPVLLDLATSTLRGSSDTKASSIATNLLWGISHYQAEEYSQAAHTFSLMIKNNAAALEEQPRLAKNIYIYQGLSYLALSKGIEHSPFLDQAITALEHAMQFDGEADDDLIFYCGLGYFFKGNSEKAVTYLQRITQESHYFADAKYLIKKMH